MRSSDVPCPALDVPGSCDFAGGHIWIEQSRTGDRCLPALSSQHHGQYQQRAVADSSLARLCRTPVPGTLFVLACWII